MLGSGASREPSSATKKTSSDARTTSFISATTQFSRLSGARGSQRMSAGRTHAACGGTIDRPSAKSSYNNAMSVVVSGSELHTKAMDGRLVPICDRSEKNTRT